MKLKVNNPNLNLKNTLKNNQKLSICFFIRISSIKTKLISVVDEKINWTPPNSILFKVLSIILQLDFYLSLLSCYFCSIKFLSLKHIFPFFFLSLWIRKVFSFAKHILIFSVVLSWRGESLDRLKFINVVSLSFTLTHAHTHTRPYTHTPSQCISWVVTPFATLSFSYFNVFHSIKHTSAHTHAHVHSHTNTHTHTHALTLAHFFLWSVEPTISLIKN